MRKTIMLGLSTIALCLGVLIGAVGSTGSGHGVIKQALAETKGGGTDTPKCANGGPPVCSACGSDGKCSAACTGAATCTSWYGVGSGLPYCKASTIPCAVGGTKVGGGGGGFTGIE